MWHSIFLGIRTTPSLQSWQSKASHRLNSVTTPRRQSNFSMSSASISYIFLRCCFLVSREVVVLNRLFSEYISFSIHHRFLFRFFASPCCILSRVCAPELCVICFRISCDFRTLSSMPKAQHALITWPTIFVTDQQCIPHYIC
jgi:hypothetical protein